MPKLYRKCVVQECKNITGARYLFCSDCWQCMGRQARQAFRLVFPPYAEHNWDVLTAEDVKAIREAIDAVRFAKSQLTLSLEQPKR